MKIKNIISKIQYLISDGLLHIFSSSVINKILGFLSNFIIVRIIDKTQYGEYTVVLNIFSFFMLLDGLGLVSAVMQKCSEKGNEEEKNMINRFGASSAFFFNCLVAILIILYAMFTTRLSVYSKNLLYLMSVIMPLNLVYEMQQVYLRYSHRNKEYSYFTTLNSLLVVVFSVFGAYTFLAYGLVVGRIIAYLGTILIGRFLFSANVSIAIKSQLAKNDKMDLIKLGIISLINIATGQLLYLIDIYVLGRIIDSNEIIAEYKVATIIPNALLFIPAALMTYYYPIFVENRENKKWFIESYKRLTVVYGVLNLLLVLTLIIIAPWMLKVTFGKQYIASSTIFSFIMVAYFFSATFRKINGNIFVAIRRLRVNFYIGMYEGMTNIILNIILVSKYGSLGAAVATLIVAFSSACISTIYLVKTIKKEALG